MIEFKKEELEKIVKESKYISEVLKKLGYDTPSNFYRIFYKYVKLYNIDISHFLTKSEIFKTYNINKKYKLEDILILDFKGSLNGNDLKKKLYKAGLKQPICELCGQDENWKIGKISLILDHIDGNNKNNLINNLRIVCPNCDAALPTYKAKNKNSYREKLKNKQERNNLKLKIIEEKNNLLKEKILNSKINFKNNGWGVLLGNYLNCSSNCALNYVKKLLPEFYQENCFKHKN